MNQAEHLMGFFLGLALGAYTAPYVKPEKSPLEQQRLIAKAEARRARRNAKRYRDALAMGLIKKDEK